MLLHVIETVIDRNPVQPCLECRFAPERRKVFEGLNENILGQVHGIIPILYVAVTYPVNLPFVPDHDLVECGGIAAEIPLNELDVGILTMSCHGHRSCQCAFHAPFPPLILWTSFAALRFK